MATKHRRGSLTAARALIKDRIVNMGQKGPFVIGHWTHGGMNDYEVKLAVKPWTDHGYSVNGINRWFVDEVWHGVGGRGKRMRAEKLWDVMEKHRAVKKNPTCRRNPKGWSKIPTSFAGIVSFDYFVEMDPAYYNEIAVESGGKAWLNKATQDEIVRRGFYGVPATLATIGAFNRGDHYTPPKYALVYNGMDGNEVDEYKTKAELIKAIQDRALHCYPDGPKGFRDPEVGSAYGIIGTNLREAGMTVSHGTLRLTDGTKKNPAPKAGRTAWWSMDDGQVVTTDQLKRKFMGKLPTPAQRRMLGIRKVTKGAKRNPVQGGIEYTIKPMHISMVRAGDTILHDGELKTLGKDNIKRGTNGRTIWGDSYRLGQKKVQVAIIKHTKPTKRNPMQNLNTVKAIGDYSVRLDGTEITIYARGGKRLARRYYSTEGLASRSYKNLTSMTKVDRFIDANC